MKIAKVKIRNVKTNIGLERLYTKGKYKYFLVGNKEIPAIKKKKRWNINL